MSRLVVLLSIFISSFSVFAQETINKVDDQGRKQGFWQKFDQAGKLIYEATFKDDRPVGEMKRYHRNGVVKAVLIFSEKSDSVSAKIFDEKKKLTAKGWYLNQKKVGGWNNFTEGRLVTIENYDEGMKNGISRRYYQTGELLDETTWINDSREGLYRAYDKKGNKYLECMYKNSKRNGWYISFYKNGAMEIEAFYKDNLRHGDWKYYTEEGEIGYILKYDEGILLTPEVFDSIQKIQFNELEKNKGKVIDPEQFLDDPAKYIQESRMNK